MHKRTLIRLHRTKSVYDLRQECAGLDIFIHVRFCQNDQIDYYQFDQKLYHVHIICPQQAAFILRFRKWSCLRLSIKMNKKNQTVNKSQPRNKQNLKCFLQSRCIRPPSDCNFFTQKSVMSK